MIEPHCVQAQMHYSALLVTSVIFLHWFIIFIIFQGVVMKSSRIQILMKLLSLQLFECYQVNVKHSS